MLGNALPEKKFRGGQIGQDFGQGVLRRVEAFAPLLTVRSPPVITSTFRHHDQMPPRIESPLFRQLIREWIALNALASSTATVQRWGRLEPVLKGHRRPGDLVDAVDAADPELKDEILGALIRLFQDGHQLAGRVVLQSMLIKLGRITNRTSGSGSDNAWAEDRRHIAVAEFWDVLADYPLARRPRKIAANLGLDTLHRLTGETRGQRPDLPVDPDDLQEGDLDRGLPGPDPVSAAVGLDVDADLIQVVTWAVAQRVITRQDASLLVEVYLPAPGTSGTALAAGHLGLSESAIRQRCSRARRLLVAAVQAELGHAAVGEAAA